MKVIKTVRFPRKKTPPSSPEKIEATDKIDKLVQESSDVLYSTKTIFPFTFFPHEIIVMRQRVDIIYGLFFFSKEVISVQIKNIFDINLDFDLFFATLDIKMTMGQEDPTPVQFLSKKDAIKLRRIITGLVAAAEKKIDLETIPKEELVGKLEKIGEAKAK